MMNSTTKKKAAGAVGGKTARACDYCIRKRARWYCAADDAFLCQLCDGSVHSANPLARRHERVRLKTASSSLKRASSQSSTCSTIIPSWHTGLKKKPRTPRRHGKHQQQQQQIPRRSHRPPLVPELGSEDNTWHDDDSLEEEQLLYRVPTFDPFMAQMLSSPTTTVNEALRGAAAAKYPTVEAVRIHQQAESKSIQSILLNDDAESSSPCDFLPSDLDLAEFAADVETLLGKGLEEESFGIHDLGLLENCKEDEEKKNIHINSNLDMNYCSTSGSGSGSGSGAETITDCGSTIVVIKTEDRLDTEERRRAEEEMVPGYHLDTQEIDMLRGEPFELTFDYEEDYPTTTCCDYQKGTGMEMVREDEIKDEGGNNKEWKMSLKLDYDAISTAWASQGVSPWMNGEKPHINPNDSWLHSVCGSDARLLYGDLATTGGQAHREDGGREARVSRYREKRRTRLFSKKIRYEVRKLNAEKRPRMKGRFVKQSSFASNPIPTFAK